MQEETRSELKNVFKELAGKGGGGEKKKSDDTAKRKMSALEQIMADEKRRKKSEKVNKTVNMNLLYAGMLYV